jgi:hypothetical protein
MSSSYNYNKTVKDERLLSTPMPFRISDSASLYKYLITANDALNIDDGMEMEVKAKNSLLLCKHCTQYNP